MINPIGEKIGPRSYVGQDSKGRDQWATLTRETGDTAIFQIVNEDAEVVFESEVHRTHAGKLAFQLLALQYTKTE
jgi:hypothetical protein